MKRRLQNAVLFCVGSFIFIQIYYRVFHKNKKGGNKWMSGSDFAKNLLHLTDWAIDHRDEELKKHIDDMLNAYMSLRCGREREAFLYLRSQCPDEYQKGRGSSTGDAPRKVRNEFRNCAFRLNSEAHEKTGTYLYAPLKKSPTIPAEDTLAMLFRTAEVTGLIGDVWKKLNMQ